ncbi:MAG: response regulator [Bacteroidia bacterium]|nr:response regulator [Bacteroidia bacterium]
MGTLDKKIFVVDDDLLTVKSYSRLLEKLGYTDIHTFLDGTSCLKELHTQPFIIFLDYQMEDLDGGQVLNKIKRFNPDVYVVMMSSQKDVTKAVETLKQGAFDYIVKGQNDQANMASTLERIHKIEHHILHSRRSLISRLINLF